jgi:hypothetical protein
VSEEGGLLGATLLFVLPTARRRRESTLLCSEAVKGVAARRLRAVLARGRYQAWRHGDDLDEVGTPKPWIDDAQSRRLRCGESG